MEIRSLSDISPDRLYRSFSEAFAGYEMQLDQQGLMGMLQRRGFDPALSFGAFDRGRLVAFTFNGTGMFGNMRTAYDTGTGTVKEYRGRGLATRIFNYSLPFLKEAGIRQYLLEVLQHNQGAVRLYRKLGFTVTREFHYYIHEKGALKFPERVMDPAYSIEDAGVRDLTNDVDFADFRPSWQNSHDSIRRSLEAFQGRIVASHGRTVAYCISEPATGDITSLAVSPEHRRRGLATCLLASFIREFPSETVKVINIPTTEKGVTAFLSSFGMEPSGKQFEMVKGIT